MTLKDKLNHKQYLIQLRNSLYQKYCTKDNPYKEDNTDLINYVLYNVISQLMLQENKAELEALLILSNRGFTNVKYQEPIPILSEGGKLEHLYIADILINDNTLIEIDGSFHDDEERKAKDQYREELIRNAGYNVKRFRTSEVYKLKEETFD